MPSKTKSKVSSQRGKLALWDEVSLGHLTPRRLVRQLGLAQIWHEATFWRRIASVVAEML